jgi:hypothetical protein
MTLSSANQQSRRMRREYELRRAASRRVNGLIESIDEMFWELEELNLKQIGRIPPDVLRRVARVVGSATGRPPKAVDVRHKTTFALDLLFDTQEGLFELRSVLGGWSPDDHGPSA